MTDLAIRPVNLPRGQLVRAESLCNLAAVLDVETQQDYDAAVDTVRDLLTLYDELEADRKFLVAPIDQEKKEIQAIYNPVLKLLQSSAQALKDRNRAFLNRRVPRCHKCGGELDAHMGVDNMDMEEYCPRCEGVYDNWEELLTFEDALRAAPISVPDTIKAEGTSYTEKWRWQITDIDSLPRDLMMPNLPAIDSYVNTAKGATNIPGVRVWVEKRINYNRKGK